MSRLINSVFSARFHIKQNFTYYIFRLFIFTVGISCGLVTIFRLSAVLSTPSSDGVHAAIQELLLKTPFTWHGMLFTLWCTTVDYLIVIFLPLIWLLVFEKGFLTGFTAGYLTIQFGLLGCVFALLGIIPIRFASTGLLLYSGTLSPIRKRRRVLPNLIRCFLLACLLSIIASVWWPCLAGFAWLLPG